MEKDIIAIIIVGIAIVSFMLERIPLAVTAMTACLAMGVLKVMPMSAVFSGFAANVTMMVAGMMIIGNGLFETGVAKAIGIKMGNSRFAQSERGFLFITVIVAGCLSGFLSNSAVTAMFLPIIAAIASRTNGRIQAKNVTMMMGMAAAVGANISMVGSTAQLVVQGILLKTEGARGLSMFEMSTISVPIFIVFVLYCVTWGYSIAKKAFDFEDPVAHLAKEDMDEEIKITWQMVLSSAVMVFCVAGFVFSLWNVGIVAMVGAAVLMVTKCIDYKKALRELDWNTLIIVGAAQGFAFGLDKSGGGKLIAQFILGVAGGETASAYVLLVIAIILATVLTNFMSNTALVAMLVPIFLPLAFALNVSPTVFAIAIIIASNCALATPIGTACVTQTLPAGYRYNDFVKVGLPINIIIMIMLIVLMPVIYGMHYQ